MRIVDSTCVSGTTAGHFYPAGTTSETQFPCPAGTWSDMTGIDSASACKNCSVGKWSSKTGRTSDAECLGSCSMGKWSNEEGLSADAQCKRCAKGTWSNASGLVSKDACHACGAGKFSSEDGVTSDDACVGRCSAGKFSSEDGLTSDAACLGRCSAGKFSSKEGLTSDGACLGRCSGGKWSSTSGLATDAQCTACIAGKFSSFQGLPLNLCQDCGVNLESTEGSTVCKKNGPSPTEIELHNEISALTDLALAQLNREQLLNATNMELTHNLSVVVTKLFQHNRHSLLQMETARTLNATNIELTAEKNALIAIRATLMKEKGTLITEKNELVIDRDGLQNDKDMLKSDKTILEAALDLTNKTVVELKEAMKANADLLVVEKQKNLEYTNKAPHKTTDSDETEETDVADDATVVAENATVAADDATVAASTPSVETARNSTCECADSVASNVSLYLIAAGTMTLCTIFLLLCCCCRKKSATKTLNPAVVVAPVQKGKLRLFLDRNHDKIIKVAHHNHAKSVQTMARTHSKAKVKIIQKKQENAKSRLQIRLHMRAKMAKMNTNATSALENGKTKKTVKVETVELDKKKAKKHQAKRKAKEERKAKKRALKAQLVLERKNAQEKATEINKMKEI